jgi:hypothetical protein
MPPPMSPDDPTSQGPIARNEVTFPLKASELHEGAFIGPYRLIKLLGEGGMGEVWLAEQTEPVRRPVALKLIKVGMDTREVVARFESERQARAMMDHPAIAKVFDAGSWNMWTVCPPCTRTIGRIRSVGMIRAPELGAALVIIRGKSSPPQEAGSL